MFENNVVGLLLIPVVMLLIGAFYIWGRGAWFRQWLRGSAGLVLLAASLVGVFLLVDLASYRALVDEKPLTVVSMKQLDQQEFQLQMTMADGIQRNFTMYGDQWQLDVRLLVWQRTLLAIGVDSLFRLERISGRYLSLEQERSAARSVYALDSSKGMDIWNLAKKYSFGVDAQFGSAVYMPLVDGGIFSVYRTGRGLVARPMNDVAKQSLRTAW